jgi:hypothetical protein
MKIYKKKMWAFLKTNLKKVDLIVSFNGLIEVATEFLTDSYIQYLIKPALTVVLLLLYWYSSTRRNPLFYLYGLIVNWRLYFIPKALTCFLCFGRCFFLSDNSDILYR